MGELERWLRGPALGVCVGIRCSPAALVAWVAPLRGASEARRSPSSGRPPPGGCRGPPPTCCGRGCAGVRAQHCPLGLHALSGLRAAGVVAVSAPAPQRRALASCRCVLWGQRKGVPVCLPPLQGGSEYRRFPLPSCPPLGGLPVPATRMLWARVCDCGGPALSPWLACPVWGCVPWGWWGAVAGGWPATVVRGVQCQALFLPRPPVLGGGQPGFRNPCVPGAVGAGGRTQHRPHSLRPCGAALRAVGVAEGRPLGGCLSPL